MPKFANAPEGMNETMEKVYSKCMDNKRSRRGRSAKESCSRIAIHGAKKAGYYKSTDGRWHKK